MNREKLNDILNGEEGAARTYGRIMTVLIVISLLPLCFKQPPSWMVAIEWVCVVIFIIDYLCRWSIADLQLKRGAVSFLLYPFTPMAIIDLLSILPAFLVINPALRTLRVLRLFRILRAFKLIRYSKGASAIATAFIKQREALGIVFALALAYVFISAIVLFNVEPETFDTFFDAVYWAMISLTTVGYGDIYPTSDIGRFFTMISAFVGIAVVALPAGIITAALLEELSEK